MKKLSKTDEFSRTAYIKTLNAAAAKVRNALGELNNEIAKTNFVISEYNTAVADADELRDEIVARMEDHVELQHHRNQSSPHEAESLPAYTEWYNEWFELDLDGLDYVDTIDEPEMEHADLLEQLPSEPQS